MLRCISAYLSADLLRYNTIIYAIPQNFFQLVLSISILVCDILFLVDSILDYLLLKDMLFCRINKSNYFILIIKKISFIFMILFIIQIIVPFTWFGSYSIGLIIFYMIILFVLFLSFKEHIHKNISVIIILIIFMILKYSIFL